MKYAVTLLVIGLSALSCSGDDGSNGANGNDGTNGASAMIATTPEPPGGNCRAGGTRVTFGVDDDGDGVLGDGEVDYTTYECQESTCLVVAGGRCAGADLRNLTIVGLADYAGDLIGLGTGDLTGIDLSGADLSNAVLIGVSFVNANLAGARLDGAIIQRATFVSSDLTGASMRGTYMAQVTMSDVDAAGLDLSASAIIAQARLLNSNFTNALSTTTREPFFSGALKDTSSSKRSKTVCKRRAPMFSARPLTNAAIRASSCRPSSVNESSTPSVCKSAEY